MFKLKTNKENGISLISLVVTIIVLLILAGISVMMVNGNNGIIKHAGNAKEIAQKEEAREQIQGEVLHSLNRAKDLKIESLKTKLEAINADITKIEDILIDDAQTGKITLNGFSFYVDYNNNVLDYSGPEETPIPEQSTTDTAFNRANGRIDIVFLNGTGYNITETPNKPSLDNTMVPVYYDTTASVWKVCSDTDTTNWYNYEPEDVSKAGTAEGDTHKNRWANVMLTDLIQVEKDGVTYNTESIKTKIRQKKLSELVGATVTTEGSMLVWIPRYAYKITYYSEPEKTTIIGYSDSRGLVHPDGKTPSDMQTPKTAINVNGTIGNKTYEYYRPHSAFETDLDQGGWSKRITGIWVGKFEATGTESAVTTISTTNNVILKRKIGLLWNSLKNNFKAGTTESHMMKNSEWGATVYLAESKFGRNEVEITKNLSKYTGEGDYKNNQNQSTTGNIFGVYDIAGGTYEFVASYIANNQDEYSYGYQFASTDGLSTSKNDKTESTPYSTVYQYDSNSDMWRNNYALSLNKIFGDGICVTSTGGHASRWSWHSLHAFFVATMTPFFIRGGGYYGYSTTIMGSFSYSSHDGLCSDGLGGSRVVCIVK